MTALVRQRRTPPAGLGTMLGAARRRSGLGLREAARRAGIGHAYLSRLESGARVPSRTVAESIADALGLDDVERAELLAVALGDAGRDNPGRRVPGSAFGSRPGAHGHQPDSR